MARSRRQTAAAASQLTRATEAGAGPKDNLFDVSFYIAGRKPKFERNDVSVMHQKILFAVCQRSAVLLLRRNCFRHTLATELMKVFRKRNLQLVKDLLAVVVSVQQWNTWSSRWTLWKNTGRRIVAAHRSLCRKGITTIDTKLIDWDYCQ